MRGASNVTIAASVSEFGFASASAADGGILRGLGNELNRLTRLIVQFCRNAAEIRRLLADLCQCIQQTLKASAGHPWFRGIQIEMEAYLRMFVIAGFLPIGIATGCARRVPEPIGGHADAPQLGWVIMSGNADNSDRDFVCQSNPPSECVIPADRPDARVLSHVHVYFHPATTETKYMGSIRIGFFEQPHEFNPNITVKPGEPPGHLSVTYFVSSRPGVYDMTVAVVATSVPTGAKTPIPGQVRVTVR